MNPNEVSKIIEKARKDNGLTQNQLADKLGVSNTAISKWENGYNLPDISMFEPINKVLGIDLFSIINVQTPDPDELERLKKNKRNKIIKNIFIMLLIFTALVTTNLLTYFITNKEINKVKSSSPEVYKITSKDKDFKIEGFIIFNDKNNLIIINDIKYHGSAQGTTDNKNCSKVKISLMIGKSTLFIRKNENTTNKDEDINILFKEILSNSTSTSKNLKALKNNFNEAHLEINCEKENGDLIKIIVNLLIEKEFR